MISTIDTTEAINLRDKGFSIETISALMDTPISQIRAIISEHEACTNPAYVNLTERRCRNCGHYHSYWTNMGSCRVEKEPKCMEGTTDACDDWIHPDVPA